MASPVIKTNFAAGELAPHLWGHTELQKYQAGLKTCRNFFVDHRGGASSRPGTAFVATAADQSASPRLMHFRFSSQQAYVLVLNADLTMNIVLRGGLVIDPMTSLPLSVAIPWTAEHLFELKFTQSADVLTVTHPSYAPTDIKRNGATDWTVTPITFGTTLIAPATVTATPIANPGGTAAQFFYAYVVTAVTDATGEQSNVGTAATCENAALDQTKGVVNKITWAASAGANSYKIYKSQPVPFGSQDAGPYFYGLIGTSASTTFSDVNYIADFLTVPPNATDPFADDNWPGVVAYFNQRKVFAGSNVNPDTFWMTRPGQYTNMDVSFPTQADDAITGTIISGEVNQIASMTPMTSGLVTLTSSGAWQIAATGSSATSPQSLTPSSVSAGPQAFSGSSGLDPLRINVDLVYQAARGGAVRSLAYNFYANVYTGQDISSLSEHLVRGRFVTQWAWAEQPHYLVWMVRDDGILLSLTYLKEQELYGWGRHDTQGIFTSVETIPEDGEDAVYFVVRRPIADGTWSYFIERLASRLMGENQAANIPTDPEAAWCLDCAVQHPLTYPADTLAIGAAWPRGMIDANSATIDAPGIGYPDTVAVDVIDDAGNGTGATVTCTASGGAIDTFVVTAPGQAYVAPRFVLHGGTGGAVSAGVVNLIEFVPGSPATLTALNVGDVVRVRGGKGVLFSFTATSFLADMVRPLYGRQMNAPDDNFMPPVASGDWSCTTPVSAVTGLDHLEGLTVGLVVDGNVQPTQTVTAGGITLEQPGSAILAGLLYTCQLGGLRLDVGEPTIQSRRKQMPAITLRMMDTRGVMVGATWKTLVEVKERSTEAYGEPIDFQIGGDFLENFVGVG